MSRQCSSWLRSMWESTLSWYRGSYGTGAYCSRIVAPRLLSMDTLLVTPGMNPAEAYTRTDVRLSR
jgi:hypothetical protein